MLGQTISHYRILEKLGEGGMGVVYKAEDTKLSRTVALKFLPHTVLAGDEERKRFSREAQAAAALNHPNIATVFTIDEVDGQTFISLELVEGQSLDKKTASGPLKLAETLDIATQICEGLQAAHEKGIVHRDIKSANIMVTEKGRVKILDFGLAKLKGVSRVTKEGTTIGTIGYMSPEQLRGDIVDHRTDIWSTGVLLYEMVSGRSPFSGDYEQAITYQILNELPEPLTAVRTGVPIGLERIVHKMLAKDPGERYQSVKEILVDLKVVGLTLTKGPSSLRRTQISGGSRSKPRRLFLLAATGCLGAILGGGVIWVAMHTSLAPTGSRQIRILTVATGKRIEEAAISPDGSQVAYTKNRLLYVRNLSHVAERVIEGTAGVKAPFWSPGGDAIGYGTETYLWRIPAAGGEPVALCKITRNYLGAYWNPSGHIIFAMAGTGIFSIPEQGGEPRNVLAPDSSQGEFDFHSPNAAPGGESMLAVLHGKDNWVSKVLVLRGQTRRTILEMPNAYLSRPTYSSTGHLLFSEDSPRYGIWAIEFSPTAGGSPSEPFMVKDGARSPSVSLDGTLVCVAGPRSVQQMAWVSRSGHIEHFIGEPLDQLRQPTISPDGRKVAVAAYLNGVMDIWIYDLQQGTLTRLHTEGSLDMDPVWSPRSDTLAFQTGEWGGIVSIVRTRAEAGGATDTLLTGLQNVTSWSRDGNFIVLVKNQQVAYMDLRESKPKPRYVDISAKVSGARLSPDGRYIAFVSEETGRQEVYLAPFPGGGRKWRVSLRGGDQPKWAKGGKELVFLVQDKLASVSFDDHPAVRIGTPQILFSPDSIRGYLSLFSWRWYDPAPDGEHFVIVTETESSDEEASVLLLENWQAGIGGGKKP